VEPYYRKQESIVAVNKALKAPKEPGPSSLQWRNEASFESENPMCFGRLHLRDLFVRVTFLAKLRCLGLCNKE